MCRGMNDASLKKHIRKEHLERRFLMTPKEYQLRSESICSRLIALSEVVNAQSVHVFLPISSKMEPNIMGFIEHLLDTGKKVVVPIADANTRNMKHSQLFKDSKFIVGAWGEPIPQQPRWIETDRYDLIILPMLAVDPRGYRLGYGKGYYDQFLSNVSGRAVGVCYDDERIESVPTESHDLPVESIITDLRSILTLSSL
jgi:5-formyltetrahydrofolate cyclo-ligase